MLKRTYSFNRMTHINRFPTQGKNLMAVIIVTFGNSDDLFDLIDKCTSDNENTSDTNNCNLLDLTNEYYPADNVKDLTVQLDYAVRCYRKMIVKYVGYGFGVTNNVLIFIH